MKTDLEIEIKKIEVEGKWFTIDYIAKYDGEVYTEEINDDHVWDADEWHEELEGGEAAKMAFRDFIEKHF